MIDTEGTLSVTPIFGVGQVFWREFRLDPGARRDVAEVDVEPAPAFPGKVEVLSLGAGGRQG